MGMAASQARLLSITARLSNNEMDQQSVAYSKQRLADSSQQISDAYLEALKATKYQFITGYNGSNTNYVDLTYNQLTGMGAIASGKQYIVKDNKGKVLVSDAIAKAYKNNNGDFNKFLRDLGVCQSDIDVNDKDASEAAIHEAWDRYLVSVGKSRIGEETEDNEHILGFGWHKFSNEMLDGYATYATATAVNNDSSINVLQDKDGYYLNNIPVAVRMNNTTGVNEVGYLEKDANGVEVFRSYGSYVEAPVQRCGEYDAVYEKDDSGNLVQDPEGNYVIDHFIPAPNDGDFDYESPVLWDNINNEFVLMYDLDENGDPRRVKNLYYPEAAPNALTLETQTRLNPIGGDTYATEPLVDPVTGFETAESYEISVDYKPLNFEGSTKDQRELYDYALSLTEHYYNNASHSSNYNYTADTSAIVNYYRNIYNEMSSCGYTTVDKLPRYSATSTNSIPSKSDGESILFQNSDWFVNCLKAGVLNMSYYSTVDKRFVGTTLDDDESITEREDASKMALEEHVYQTKMARIQSEDKQFDLRLNRLEAEHNTLQTEYDAVKSVISKNVEKSFNVFS